MNTLLNETEEQQLRDHFALKVHPRYKPSTINKIVTKINDVRIGRASEEDWVNNDTKILKWLDMFESWNLYPRFLSMKIN